MIKDSIKNLSTEFLMFFFVAFEYLFKIQAVSGYLAMFMLYLLLRATDAVYVYIYLLPMCLGILC